MRPQQLLSLPVRVRDDYMKSLKGLENIVVVTITGTFQVATTAQR